MNAPFFVPVCPSGKVTTIGTVPAARAAVVAVMVVGFTTVGIVAGVPPKVTVTGPSKFVPVIVTLVPPAADPWFGATPVTAGMDT